MQEPRVTLLWLVDARPSVEATATFARLALDERRPDRRYPAAAIAAAIGEGPVLAVVDDEERAQDVLAMGVDDVVRLDELETPALERAVARVRARARGRGLRDLHVVDLVRRDDISVIDVLSSELGRQLIAPLTEAREASRSLTVELRSRPEGEAPSAERLVSKLESIQSTITNAARVADDLVHLYESEGDADVVDLGCVVAEVVPFLRRTVERVAQFAVDLPQVPALVALPRWQAVQIVTALVGNAVAAVEEVSPSRYGVVTVAVLVADDAVCLQVVDDGVGMSPGMRTRVFDPFFITRASDETGLRLPLTRARVRRAGGELLIDSSPGAGTAVRVFLPCARPSPGSGGVSTSN